MAFSVLSFDTLWMLVFISIILQVETTKETTEYVKIGGTAVLRCPKNSINPTVTWKRHNVVYAVAKEVNKNLPNHERISAIQNSDQTYLQIENVTLQDLGTYVCISRSAENVIMHSFNIQIMVLPSNMTVFGDEYNTVYAQVDQNKTLLCKIKSGIPKEKLIWRRHNEILASGTGEVEYNFTAKQSDNLKELVCEARQIGLDHPIMKSVQIIILHKPAIYIIADPRTHVQLGENTTLVCVIENPVNLKSIFWLKNGDILLNASSIFQIVNLEIDDTGMYICKATNKIGNSSAVINIGLIPEDRNFIQIIFGLCILSMTLIIFAPVFCGIKIYNRCKSTSIIITQSEIQSTEARYETIEEMDIGDLQQPEIPGIPTANSENLTISTDGYELECYRNSDLSSTEHSSCNSNYQYCTNSYESVHVADLFVNGDHSYESVLREKQYEGKKTLKKIKSAPF